MICDQLFLGCDGNEMWRIFFCEFSKKIFVDMKATNPTGTKSSSLREN